jgi:hypothetical protein
MQMEVQDQTFEGDLNVGESSKTGLGRIGKFSGILLKHYE